MAQPQRIPPAEGQESVWDYPRPPRVEEIGQHIQVIVDGVVIADSRRVKRVLETSHPPVYYIPPEDVKLQYVTRNHHASWCEYKGEAGYYNLELNGKFVQNIAWVYAAPTPAFSALNDHLAFYPSKVDSALIDGELVQAQVGDFYGGWITKNIVGPIKGGPGTSGW